ncbi:MAG: ZIP family metal transporter [Solirubrobacterales bacterium]
MAEAAFWGAVAASSLLIGAVVAIRVTIPRKAIGLILGFGAGTLISAMAFELTEEAFRLGGADAVAIGLALGALAYFAGDTVIERRGGQNRMSSMGDQADSSANALLLGAVLDGIPESAVLGITLLEGSTVGVAVLAAIFLSNLPEALSSTTGMRMAKQGAGRVLTVWSVVVIVSAVSAALGYGLLDGASGNTVGLIQAFAGGAVLTMLVDTMIPEAFARGGRAVGLFTVLGFALAYLLSTLE